MKCEKPISEGLHINIESFNDKIFYFTKNTIYFQNVKEQYKMIVK